MIRAVAAPAAAPMDPAECAALVERLRMLVARRLGLLIEPRENDRLRDVLMRLAAQTRPSAWLDRLEQRATQADLDLLAAELTVGETYFFRHPEQFDALRTVVLPTWLRRHPAPRRLRALCAGCASGEEPYTLAMTLMRSVLGAGGVDWDIVAFDVNAAALRRAVAARYNEWSLRATSPTWRDLWFRRDEAGWTPLPTLRRRVRFEQRQIAMPDARFWAPDSFDVIFCRNMLMYLDAPSLRRAVDHLATALAPGGALFLGHAETLHSLTDRLELRKADGCFYYQRRPDPQQQGRWPFNTPEGAAGTWDAARAGPEGAMTAGVPRVAGVAVPGGTGTAAGSPDALGTGWGNARGVPPGTPPGQHPADPADQGAAEAMEHFPQGGALAAGLPASMATPLDEAMQLVESGQLEDGMRACARLMEGAAPAALQADALFIQALALEERGELAAAEWHHQRAAAKDAAFAMPHLRLGLMARRRGEPVAARRELRRALDLLDGESGERVRRFGGGFERDALRQLCLANPGEQR